MNTTNLKAILTDKAMTTGGYYCVIATCSGCAYDHFVAFAGWSALKCHGCKGYMERTPYRKADTPGGCVRRRLYPVVTDADLLRRHWAG